MNHIKVEIPQTDGITVKERIILFFLNSNAITRQEADMLYETAETQGFKYGVEAFDKCISLICYELGLSEGELEKEINNHDNTKSN